MTSAQERPATPPPTVRAADADREAAADRVRDAVAEGSLDLAELDERVGAIYAAKTKAELELVTADLPGAPAVELPPLNLRTKSGSLTKDGDWNVPSKITAECTSGTIKIDFTRANCRHREVEVTATARSGSVILIVPLGWAVDLDQASATSGTVSKKLRAEPQANAPVLRVNGQVRSGSIKARNPRRGFWAWLLRRPA